MGKEVAETHDEEPQTMEVTTYKSEVFGIKFIVIDTPGLCDDLDEEVNDEIYVDKIISNVKRLIQCGLSHFYMRPEPLPMRKRP